MMEVEQINELIHVVKTGDTRFYHRGEPFEGVIEALEELAEVKRVLTDLPRTMEPLTIRDAVEAAIKLEKKKQAYAN